MSCFSESAASYLNMHLDKSAPIILTNKKICTGIYNHFKEYT